MLRPRTELLLYFIGFATFFLAIAASAIRVVARRTGRTEQLLDAELFAVRCHKKKHQELSVLLGAPLDMF